MSPAVLTVGGVEDGTQDVGGVTDVRRGDHADRFFHGDLAGGAMSIEGVGSPIQHWPVLEYEAIPRGRIAGRTPLRELKVCRMRDAHDLSDD